MAGLVLAPNIADPDGFFERLALAQEGMDERAAHAFAARLALVLANHVGDAGVLAEAIEAAREA